MISHHDSTDLAPWLALASVALNEQHADTTETSPWQLPLAQLLAAAARGQGALARQTMTLPSSTPPSTFFACTDDWVILPYVADAWQRIAQSSIERQTAIHDNDKNDDSNDANETLITETLERILPPYVEKNDAGETVFSNADQRRAVAGLATQRLGVLSGGPGTGKTTTAAALLVIQKALNPDLVASDVLVAAPTGKAANRLRQSLHKAQNILHLTADETAFLTALEPQTLHRALGWRPIAAERGGPFTYSADAPMPYRLALIDESSMTDITLSATLMQSLPTTSPLFFLGDCDQLDSVESGGMLAALITSAHAAPPSSQQVLQQLAGRLSLPNEQAAEIGSDHSHALPTASTLPCPWPLSLQRQQAHGLQMSYRAKSAPWVLTVADLCRPAQRQAPPSSTGLTAIAESLSDQQLKLFQQETAFIDHCRTLWRHHHSKCDQLPGHQLLAHANELLQIFQCLAATNDDVQRLNTVGLSCQNGHRHEAASLWHGTPVLITSNDHQLGLYNGDIGIALSDNIDEPATSVFFPERTPEKDQSQNDPLPRGLLPSHTAAYALTIHKSQGSEWQHVAIHLPINPPPNLLTHNLLYTAVTRSSQNLSILQPGFDAVINNG